MSYLKMQLLAVLLGACSLLTAQPTTRGLYVNGTSSWLGDTARENGMLRYAQLMSFNSLTLYDLNFNWTPQMKNKLASFISKAKNNYGVAQVGASAETYNWFANKLVPYNNSRTNPSEKFDVLNYEFEFWLISSINSYYAHSYLIPNGYAADTSGAFAYAWKNFQKIDSLCRSNGLISEIYLGWPTEGQMQKIASIADRILLHAYRTTDIDVYQYSVPRLNYIASLHSNVKVLPIFSSEPVFMQNWLSTHPLQQAYQTYEGYYNADTTIIGQHVDLTGYQWFVYGTMPNPVMNAIISASGPISFCLGDSVTLTANAGSSYLWMPGGATTRSITVNSPGTYSVNVTDSSGHVSVSPPMTVVVTTNGTAPTVTASGPLKVCTGGSVILTSSLASSYLWSNGATTRSITVSTSGNYTVSSASGSCNVTSAPVNFMVVAPPPVPVITADGSLNVCPGSPVTLTASPADGYLWSNGSTSRSIIVGATGNYSVRSYSAPYCSSMSGNTAVQQLQAPPTPTVSINGLTALSPANPVVTLTSSLAAGYSWSNGQTIRSIMVNTQGSYRVTIRGTNGCKAISAPVTVSANGCTPPPVPLITASGSTNLNPGQSVTLTSTLAAGYLWSDGSTTRAITVNTAGTYSVRAYSSGTCFSTSLPVTVKIIPARMAEVVVAESEPKETISLYPNPAREFIRTSFNRESAGKGLFRVVDVKGAVVFEQPINATEGRNELSFDVAPIPPGLFRGMILFQDAIHSESIVITD